MARFHFDFDKTLQIVAELLRYEPRHQMSRLRLLKLVYIADRESIAETGLPITGDRVVAMKHGPVLSRLYDIIKGEASESPRFQRYVECQGHQLHLLEDPGHSELNRYEIRKLRELSTRYREFGDWELVEETHTFPEWIQNDPGNSSRIIPMEDVLRAVGVEESKIPGRLREMEDRTKLRELFPES